MIERLPGGRGRAQSLQLLSDREREVLALMAAGRTNHAICHALSLSSKTVESHVLGRARGQPCDCLPPPTRSRRSRRSGSA